MKLQELADSLTAKNLTLSCVESCTGGLLAKSITDLAGSSSWFNGGLITYSNAMKIKLGVNAGDIETHGAVSRPVVEQMAINGLNFCASDWSIAVTGIAGPGGGSIEKPVGTVWMAWANRIEVTSQVLVFPGDRAAIRTAVADYVFQQMHFLVKK